MKDPRLEFYRGEGVKLLLERYSASEEEKRRLYRAVRMVKRGRVDWAFIEETDKLVKEIHSRKPIVSLDKDLLERNRERTNRLKAFTKSIPPMRSWQFLLIIALLVIFELSIFVKIFNREPKNSYDTSAEYTPHYENRRAEKSEKNEWGVARKTKESKEDTSRDHLRELKTSHRYLTSHHYVQGPRENENIIMILNLERLQNSGYCTWREGKYRIRFDPYNEQNLTKKKCEGYYDLAAKAEFRVLSHPLDGWKRVGALTAKGGKLSCTVTLYTDRYRRFYVGLVDTKSLEGCSAYLNERKRYRL